MARLRTAQAYLETAQTVIDESAPREFANVAAGNAVLAGIAASDALCCLGLGRRHRGDDHRGAADLLRQAVHDGPALAVALRRLLDVKDTGHYGARLIDLRGVADAIRRAERLTARAREELER